MTLIKEISVIVYRLNFERVYVIAMFEKKILQRIYSGCCFKGEKYRFDTYPTSLVMEDNPH